MSLGKCEWGKCNRPATRLAGWDHTPMCDGHTMLGRWNKDTWGWKDFTEEDKTKMLVQYKIIKKWMKENPNPDVYGENEQ